MHVLSSEHDRCFACEREHPPVQRLHQVVAELFGCKRLVRVDAEQARDEPAPSAGNRGLDLSHALGGVFTVAYAQAASEQVGNRPEGAVDRQRRAA